MRVRLPGESRGRVLEPDRWSNVSGVGMLTTAQAARMKPARRDEGKASQLTARERPEALWSKAANCQRRWPKRGMSASQVPGLARSRGKTRVPGAGPTGSGAGCPS